MGCIPSKTHPFKISVENQHKCMPPCRPTVISTEVKKKEVAPSFTDPRCGLPVENDKIVSHPKEVISNAEKDVIKACRDGKIQASTDSRMSNFSFNSSTSKDSGVYVLDEKYSHVITEFSEKEKVQQVEKDFKPQDQRDLIVKGSACKTMTMILPPNTKEELRGKGLMANPESHAAGGVSFDLIAIDAFAESIAWHQKPMLRPLLPPIRIQRRIKKKKKELTREEIARKLDKAEERRKQQEEERLARLATRDRIQKVTSAELEQAEKNRQRQIEKMEASTLCRQQHLSELREKLRARAEHHSNVRQRKLMSAIRVA